MMDPKSWTTVGIVKVLIPASILFATTVAAASWRQSLSNEHRLTATEAATTYNAKALDATLARQLMVEQKFDLLIQGVGRIEGALAERNRAEPMLAKHPRP